MKTQNSNLVIAESVVSKLKSLEETMAVAESCTGGGIGEIITKIPGSSEIFVGGIIAYSNDVKEHLLGVSESIIENYGAVSEQSAAEMVNNVCNIFDVSFGISTTGIAGPGGGTLEKPVGTVWIAVATPNEVITEKNFFSGGRNEIREQTIFCALKILDDELKNFI